MDVASRGVERERNSLAPPTLDIYLPLSNLSLYDAARDLRTSRPLKFPNLIVSLTRFGHVLEGYVGPLFSICVRTRRLCIELIFGVRCPRPACVGRGLTDQGAVS